MKVPLIYPKIPDGINCPLKKCIAFEKLDGTNIHWVWNKDKGWNLFGTRRSQFSLDLEGIIEFNQTHPGLESAPEIFNQDFKKPLTDFLFQSKLYYCAKSIVLFTEFLGSQSFAGTHIKEDNKKLIIIDVSIDNKIISPQQLIYDWEESGNFEIPKVIYCGKYTGQFIEDVRNGKYPVNEGVVCKGVVDGQVYMTKIKTNAYLQKLKSSFKDSWQDYWE